MVTPAPVSTVKEKLLSPTPDVRVVALLHSRAHGPAACSLAAQVARMFEDESARVQWYAMGAFQTLGHGAADAVSVLVRQLEQGTPRMLVVRALAALQTIGPAASAALDVVMKEWETTTDEREKANALETLASIGPADARVRKLLVASMLLPSFTLSSSARSALERAPSDLVDYALHAVRERGVGADVDERLALANILGSLAPLRPGPVGELLREPLARVNEPCAAAAVYAVSQLPASHQSAYLHDVVRVAGEGGLAASERALELLASLGALASGAEHVLLRRMAEHEDALPLGGPLGNEARVFAMSAEAVSVACIPPPPGVVGSVTRWLRKLPSTEWPEEQGPSWYIIRKVVVAAARTDPRGQDTARALVAVAQESRRWIDTDESGVMDFERSLTEALHWMGDPPALWAELETLGIHRSADDEERPDEGEEDALPDFPPEAPPKQPARLRSTPLPNDVWSALADTLPRGEALAEVGERVAPEAIAKAIDVVVRRAQRTRTSLTNEDVWALGVLWGKAIVDGAGWTWAEVGDGDSDVKHICVVSEDRAHACPPLAFMARQATMGTETTVLLLYNMIVAGTLAGADAGRLSFVT